MAYICSLISLVDIFLEENLLDQVCSTDTLFFPLSEFASPPITFKALTPSFMAYSLQRNMI